MDECELFPELCLYGECIDTRDSYRCKCPPGYKLGPRGVMCKGKYDISFSFSSFWVSFKLLLEHWKDQKAPIATVACSLIGWQEVRRDQWRAIFIAWRKSLKMISQKTPPNWPHLEKSKNISVTSFSYDSPFKLTGLSVTALFFLLNRCGWMQDVSV